jgi:myo-inositol-1(or 4)-monophosphatase
MFDLQPVLNEIRDFLPEITAYQLSFFRNPEILHGYLKSPKELVSQVDITSEKMIRSHLARIMPEAAFYGEETDRDIAEFTWVVDPVDGTVNFVSGLPEWSISIALLYNREPIIALIAKPTTQELFTALKGEGAYLDQTRLPIMPFHGTLQDSVIATAFPFRSPHEAPGFYAMAQQLLPRCREIRRFGSAALDLSYIAAGFMQGYWETDIKLYDVAAALLILDEAGFQVRDFYGESYDPFTSRSLCAGHPAIIDELTSLTSEYYAEYRASLTTKEQQ